ncbi:MAG: endonuclease, partial [Paracoccus sp. (in: a-proteobacteria)]
LARPGDVIDRSEPYRERITDEDRAREITREVDRIMEGRDLRTPVADAVAEAFRDRYPDMPSHLARGLGATYVAVTDLRNTEAINQVRRENELRETRFGSREERLADGRDAVAVDARPIADAEIRRVIDHERAGNLQSPFQDESQRLAYRDAVERDLDAAQIDRLRDGTADVLKILIEDRLDRLYVAKTYLQSDAATANSEAARAVVEEIADREFELQRTDLVDGESERGETH